MTLWDDARLRDAQARLAAAQADLRAAMAEVAEGPVTDYVFATPDGPVRLSELFGRHRHLIAMHSMGVTCPNCTMVCDGFNGLYPHLAGRAAFVVTGPDAPEVQASFAAARGWRFPLVSHAGTSFAEDMGFLRAGGGWRPGVSAFGRDGDAIRRVSATDFHAETDFCAIWRLFDLLPDGRDGWRPKFLENDR